MRTLIVGASAGLGRALAEELARRGHNLGLLASDGRDLAPLCTDLALRFGTHAVPIVVDLYNLDAGMVRAVVLNALGGLDKLIYVAGWSVAKVDSGPIHDALAERLMSVNFEAAVRLINAFLPDLQDDPNGSITVISTVASARARGRNTVYAASKHGMEFYVHGLRHYLAKHPCRTQVFRAGYLDTRMNFGESRRFPKLAPAVAARVIADRLGDDIALAYVPRRWALIMTVINLLPWIMFRRMKI